MIRFLSVIVGFLIVLSSTSVEAQRKLYSARFTKKKHYWSIGGTLGGALYKGDIGPSNTFTAIDFGETKGNIGFFAMYRLLPRVSIRGGLNYISISGDDNNVGVNLSDGTVSLEGQQTPDYGRWKRNLHFRNRIVEAQLTAIFDLFPNRGVYYARPNVPIPYLIGGISIGYSNPQAIAPDTDQWGVSTGSGGDWVDLRPLQTEGKSYSPLVIGFPMGVGARMRVANRLDVAIEMLLRYTRNDYLDDVSGTYTDPAALSSPLARAMSDRSLETTAANTGASRGNVDQNIGRIYYNGYPMGNGYTPGEARGGEFAPNASGTPYDVYMTFGFHAYYIIPNSITTTAKFGRRYKFSKRRYKRRR